MSNARWLTAACCGAALFVEPACAFASRATGIAYSSFVVVQIGLYVAIGFVVRRVARSARAALLAVVAAALLEATFGWLVAAALGLPPSAPSEPRVVVSAWAIALAIFIACGSAGIWLGARLSRTSEPATPSR